MPVDPARMRQIVEWNEKVTEGVRGTSQKIEHLDQRDALAWSQAVRVWAQNTIDLKSSLDEQKGLIRDMRESARIQDQQQSESFHEKYRFLVERLKADIRKLFQSLQNYIDLPPDFARSRTWNDCIYDLEMDLKGISASNVGKDILSVEPLAMLLNYRDAVVSMLLNGLLFRKAVLDWDLKGGRAYADGPMAEMSELVVNIYSKTESLPAKYRPTALPTVLESGPFTCKRQADKTDKVEKVDKGAPSSLTPLQSCMLATLRELQVQDMGLRSLAFDEKVHISNKGDPSGKNTAASELQKEMVKWFEKYSQLNLELSSSKGKRHSDLEAEIESLTNKLNEKDEKNKNNVTRIHKLEGDVQSLKYELTSLSREKNHLADQNQRIAKESLPVIDKIGALVSKSREAAERLTQDSCVFSTAFRQQVKENKGILEDRDSIETELAKVNRQLDAEKQKNIGKETELQKKETLYLRTMAARKHIQESYEEQRDRILKVEENIASRENDRQEMLKVAEGRECEIKQLLDDLSRARGRIEELKQQRERCGKEYKSLTGRNLDFSKFKAVPTIGAA